MKIRALKKLNNSVKVGTIVDLSELFCKELISRGDWELVEEGTEGTEVIEGAEGAEVIEGAEVTGKTKGKAKQKAKK